MIKKWLLAFAGISFALSFTSCDEHAKKMADGEKCAKEEKHSRRW